MKNRVWAVLFLATAIAACTDSPVATKNDPVASLQEQYLANSASSATDPLSKANRLPESLEQKVKAVRTDLEGRGYQVARGYWTLWGADDCKAPLQTIGFCYGNNPTAPYGLAVVPRWKDEHVDQPLHHALLKGQRNMSSIYRLDEREALVIMAQMPPPARYFGMMTNVFTRETTLNTADPVYQSITASGRGTEMLPILFAYSPVPSRMMMISTIGNTTNNVTIERQSGSVWGEQRFFVVTPDQGMADEMTQALVSAGVPAEDIFTEPVSPDLMRLGLGPEADDFITIIRYALPDDPAAGEQWRKELPVTVLRVRDPDPSPEILDPFPLPSYDVRTFGFDENELAPELDALVSSLKDRWGQPTAPEVTYFSLTRDFDLIGQHCLGSLGPSRGPMDCLGDNQDDDPLIGPSVNLDGDTVLAVVGVLATETANATYVSLSVNWFPRLVGLLNLSDIKLKGSAAEYADVLGDDAGLFYVQYFARDCRGLEHCLEVSSKVIPAGETIKAIVRNYVVPGDPNGRGPDPDKLLMPKAIILDGSVR